MPPLIRKDTEPRAQKAPDDLAGVAAALAHGTDDERWAAARAAHGIAGSGALVSQALARESNPVVREALFTSLARNATAEGVELLLPFLRSDDAHLRVGALDALRAMKGAAWPYLPRLFEDADSDIRILACELVRGAASGQATTLLRRLLESEQQPNVCAAAVEVLAEVGGPEALAVLSRCEQRFRDHPFLAYSIKVAAERIRSGSSEPSA